MEMEEYLKTIAIREEEIKSLNTAMIETHRKSWSALVSPLLAVKVNIPVMYESSSSNQRKSKESKASAKLRERGRSISFFK
ncbi:hypothetical protein K502DRAFT_323022 [Neoconidiobolus thromboides FSU 785]|nr:hypothetical protein K502DRAFT_323022 [Neoconidiobolus thromboides FSU 785]